MTMDGTKIELTQRQRVALERVGSGEGPIATQWISAALGHEFSRGTAPARRVLASLRKLGLVEGVEASGSGRVFWWRITPDGKLALNTLPPSPSLSGRVGG